MGHLINLLPAKTIQGIAFLDFSNIIRIEADHKHTLIFSKGSDKHIRSILSFGTLEEMLPQTFFFKSHRSHIINLLHLKEFDKCSCKIYLTDNHDVTIAEDRIADFLRVVGNMNSQKNK